MSVALVSTVRTNPDDMRLFVRYYLNGGISALILFFDDPCDPMIEELGRNTSVLCIACDRDHWAKSGLPNECSIEQRQVYNANVALGMAQSRNIEWILHVDSDELIFTKRKSIDEYLSSFGRNVDVVRFPTYEAVAEIKYDHHIFTDIKFFKTEDSFVKGAKALALLLGCSLAFENGYIKAHSAGKSASRVESAGLHLGIHTPTSKESSLRVIKSNDAYLLHYDCCTFADWHKKWKRRNDGTATAMEMREERRNQFAEFIKASETGSELALYNVYKRQYIIPKRQRLVLRMLGLLKRVEIGKQAFAASS